jgi:accessory gene regulator protein AgrB
MEILKEHRKFRNQSIITTLILFGVSWFMPEITAFVIMVGLLALLNIFTYRENVRDYNKLKDYK